MGTGAVDELRAAAYATRAAGSARVHARTFVDPPQPAERDTGSVADGVTDFARSRTRVDVRLGGLAWGRFEEILLERWPWLSELDGDEDDGEDVDEPLSMGIVYAGTARFVGDDQRGWHGGADGDVNAPGRQMADPVWIVEVLRRVDGADARGMDETCGEPCRRFGFGIDVRAHRERLALPSRGGLGNPGLAGEAWIDAAGRIRRATWTTYAARRPRSPLRNVAVVDGLWHTTELSDFGVEVDIQLPVVVDDSDLPSFPRVLYEVAGTLWRAKRAYARRAPAMPDNTDYVN